MNTPAASAAINLRQSNPSLMPLFQFARSAGAKCKKYFQTLVWSLKVADSIKLIHVKIQRRKIVNPQINLDDVADDSLGVRDLAHSLLSLHLPDQPHHWSPLARYLNRSSDRQTFLNSI